MKNMKKILAVGALLTLGTMVMADGTTDNANFKVNLKVIKPITITKNTDVDFGNLTTTQMTDANNTADGTFTVDADDADDFRFIVTVPKPLTKVGSTETIDFTADILDSTGNNSIKDDRVNTSGGTLDGKLRITLASTTGVVTGDYDGTVNIAVDYN